MPTISWGHSQYWAGSTVVLDPRAAIVFWTEFETPNAPRSAYVFWAEVETPSVYVTETAHPKSGMIDEMLKESAFHDSFQWTRQRRRPAERKEDPDKAIDDEQQTDHQIQDGCECHERGERDGYELYCPGVYEAGPDDGLLKDHNAHEDERETKSEAQNVRG